MDWVESNTSWTANAVFYHTYTVKVNHEFLCLLHVSYASANTETSLIEDYSELIFIPQDIIHQIVLDALNFSNK